MKKIEEIKTDLLTYKQDRINRGDLKALAENIKTYGLQHPLLVTANNGKYEIVDGRRRFEAIRLNGAQTAPCIVLTEQEANEDLSLILNTHRLNLGPVELYKMAVRYVKDELKDDPDKLRPELIKKVAEKLNLDIHAACRILNIGRMDNDVRELLQENKISLRLALLTIHIESRMLLKRFCAYCVKERPSTRNAINEIRRLIFNFGWNNKKAPYRDLGYAPFDTAECETCKYRGRRNKSLFEDISTKEDHDDQYCWNPTCYQKKENRFWNQAITEAREKLVLRQIKKAPENFQHWNTVAYTKIVPQKKSKCMTCTRVKMYHERGESVQAVCPQDCANIEKTKGSAGKKKSRAKVKKEYTRAEKKQILEERFAIAARKAMIEHFFDGKKQQKFKASKEPTNHKRILFFVGCDAHTNPFQWSYDRSGITPRRIDDAIALLYGETNWCKTHYDDILAKLSKRSRQFLEDVKPWRPSWAGAAKKRKKK